MPSGTGSENNYFLRHQLKPDIKIKQKYFPKERGRTHLTREANRVSLPTVALQGGAVSTQGVAGDPFNPPFPKHHSKLLARPLLHRKSLKISRPVWFIIVFCWGFFSYNVAVISEVDSSFFGDGRFL